MCRMLEPFVWEYLSGDCERSCIFQGSTVNMNVMTPIYNFIDHHVHVHGFKCLAVVLFFGKYWSDCIDKEVSYLLARMSTKCSK